MPGGYLYDWNHRKRRKGWLPQVLSGTVRCARCQKFIRAGEPWDLGHVDHDRSRYAGPEHRKCNRATNEAGRKQKFSRRW